MLPNFDLTLEQLRSMTRAQIRQAITDAIAPMSKREMIQWLLQADIVNDPPLRTYGADGQIIKQVEIDRDAETRERVRGKVTTWTYYPTGEVDTIIISDRDAVDGEISRRRIKHYRDGRPPKEL